MIYYSCRRRCTYFHVPERVRRKQGVRQARVGYPVTGAVPIVKGKININVRIVYLHIIVIYYTD